MSDKFSEKNLNIQFCQVKTENRLRQRSMIDVISSHNNLHILMMSNFYL